MLGLIREDQALLRRFLKQTNVAADIRAEVEKVVPPRERSNVSVEIPLTNDSKRVLILAAEEADKLGHAHVGTEHLLLGMLRVKGSLAARLLGNTGLKPDAILERLPKTPGKARLEAPAEPSTGASETLGRFLAGLKSLNSEDLISFFAQNAEFIDASGKRWKGQEIRLRLETLFAP